MENSVKQRVEEFCKVNKLSIREFERKIDVSYGYFSHLKSNGVSHEKVKKIIFAFPTLNIDWLLTGKGEMLRPNQVQNINGDHNTTTMNGDIQQTTESNRTDRLIESNLELIRQHGELIRQQGELIEMLKKLKQQD